MTQILFLPPMTEDTMFLVIEVLIALALVAAFLTGYAAWPKTKF